MDNTNVTGEEKNIDDDHALIMFRSGVVDLLATKEPAPETTGDIATALGQLDPENDDHWTGSGLPAMAAVEERVGSKDIKRADVEAALPGWNRDASLEAATNPAKSPENPEATEGD